MVVIMILRGFKAVNISINKSPVRDIDHDHDYENYNKTTPYVDSFYTTFANSVLAVITTIWRPGYKRQTGATFFPIADRVIENLATSRSCEYILKSFLCLNQIVLLI